MVEFCQRRRSACTNWSFVAVLLNVMLPRLALLSSSGLVRPTVAWTARRCCSSRSVLTGGAAAPLSWRLYSSATPNNKISSSDDSAMSRSRAPFRMPKNSPDDSIASSKKNVPSDLSWNHLGLWTELVDVLRDEMKLSVPTPVQDLVIPRLLQEEVPHLTFLAATGSGKTLSYCLPLMQQLKTSEVFIKDERKLRRPRLLIIAPTRELVLQIKDVVKQLSHSIKLSSTALVGGQDYGKQRKGLNRLVDVLVSTPGRLLQHWKEGNVFLGDVEYVVMDEMDTLLEQGFQNELREILYPILYPRPLPDPLVEKEGAPKVILTSATMTQSISKIIGHSTKDDSVTAKKHYTKPGTENTKLQLPPMQVLKAAGLHKTVPRLEQVFVDVGNIDKISLLVDIVSSEDNGQSMTMVFCNTAASCRAVQFALAESRVSSLSYHGELNSILRSENLKRFRLAGKDPTSDEPRVLVCTDLAARGLDVPQVDRVVMFDFPLNALDYLHRSGRTARGDIAKGKVMALVTKRDRVLASAIEQAVLRGEPLDGLSSRKSDYLIGGRLERKGRSRNNTNKNHQRRSYSSTKARRRSPGKTKTAGRRGRAAKA